MTDSLAIDLILQIMARVMGTDAALVRMQLVSGTHAISTALFACLRPGDCMLAVAGRHASLLPCLLCRLELFSRSSSEE